MKRLTLIFIALCLAVGLKAQSDPKVMIFSKDSKIIGFNIADYSRFTPKYTDYSNIDSLIANYVLENSGKLTLNNKPINNYSEYFKQVYGLLNSDAEQIIFVNCFFSVNDNVGWENETVTVKGGGRNYFSLKINLSDNTIFDFGINAPK